MNEKKPTWICPVCDKKAAYESLIIDGLVKLNEPLQTKKLAAVAEYIQILVDCPVGLVPCSNYLLWKFITINENMTSE